MVYTVVCSGKEKEKFLLVGVGYGRPWIDQWRPGPKRGLGRGGGCGTRRLPGQLCMMLCVALPAACAFPTEQSKTKVHAKKVIETANRAKGV